VRTCLPPLLIHVWQSRSQVSPTVTGESIAKTGLQPYFNNPSSALESHRNSAREFLKAVASYQGDERRQTHNCLQQLLYFYRDKGVGMKPVRGILVALELGILRSLSWQAVLKAGLGMFLGSLVLSLQE